MRSNNNRLNDIELTLPGSPETNGCPTPKAERTAGDYLTFFVGNVLITGTLGVVCVYVSSAGLERLIPLLGSRLYTFPPFAELKWYEGWRNVSISMLAASALVLFGIGCWYCLARIANQWETAKRDTFWRLCFRLYLLIVAADAYLIYVGLATREVSSYEGAEASAMNAFLAAVLYTALMAAWGAWHWKWDSNK